MALSKDSLRSQSVPHCLLLRGEGAGRADEVASLIFPSSVSHLRGTREPPIHYGAIATGNCWILIRCAECHPKGRLGERIATPV